MPLNRTAFLIKSIKHRKRGRVGVAYMVNIQHRYKEQNMLEIN